MKLEKNKSFLAGIVYFLLLLSVAFFVRDISGQPDAFTLTLQELIKTSQMGDPASFATAAIDIAKNGWISNDNEWILNLWPPGFILLEALIVKLFGPAAPVILVLQILAAGLFSIVLALLHNFLRTLMSNKLAFVLPLIVFCFPVSRVFLLQPTGISLGESFSIGFFLISVFMVISAKAQKNLYFAVYAGICLALSAYFRSQFEIFILALTGWGILLTALFWLTRLRNFMEPKSLRSAVKIMAVTLLVAHAATIPWRAYHWYYQGSPNWVFTSSVTFGNSVMTSEYLENNRGSFVVAGGGNLVCRISPDTCGDTANAKRLFIKTLLEHPVEWYSLKLGIIGKYWFSELSNWSNISAPPTAWDIATNGFLLIALLAIIYMLFSRRVRGNRAWVILLWINASLYSSYFLIFTVQQFEARYFYFPKIAGLVMLVVIASLFIRAKEIDARIDSQSIGCTDDR